MAAKSIFTEGRNCNLNHFGIELVFAGDVLEL